MCISSTHGKDDKILEGVVSGHAYSLLNCKKIKLNGKSYSLIKLRNPHAKNEYQGDFSDNSRMMNASVRAQLSYNENKDDGIFWIPLSKVM